VPTLLISSGITVPRSLGYTFLIAIAAPIGRRWGSCSPTGSSANGSSPGAALALPLRVLPSPRRTACSAHRLRRVADPANNILSFAYHGYQPGVGFPPASAPAPWAFVYSFSAGSHHVQRFFVIAAILKSFGAPGVFVFIAGCMGIRGSGHRHLRTRPRTWRWRRSQA